LKLENAIINRRDIMCFRFDWKKLLSEDRCVEGFRDVKRSEYDKRNGFENDYDRIVTSSSLRRMQDKTQVMILRMDIKSVS
jgi:dGTPase